MHHSRSRPTRPVALFHSGRALILAAGLFAGGLLAGTLAGRAALTRVQAPYADVDLFARVIATIEEDYVEAIPPDALVDGAIRGMLRGLDSQSRWLDPSQLRTLRDDAEGTKTGLGIEVGPASEGVEVLSVDTGSHAAKDGLQPGDRILEVDGVPITRLEEVQRRLSGSEGQVAELTVTRDGWDEPRTIRTARQRVPREVVRGSLVDQVAYVRVEHFQEGTASALEEEVRRLASSVQGLHQLQGLVLDLRDNPGGLLSEAVAVSDLFLDDGIIVSTQARRDGPDSEVHHATPGGLPPTLRTVVLVNGMSASASEIVAGALQDTQRAVLVGQPTYGKGTVQKVYLVNARSTKTHADAALKLTVGRYYTPSGAPVAPREGRTPDHHVSAASVRGPKAELRDSITALDVPRQEQEALLELVDAVEEPEVPAEIRWDIPAPRRMAIDPPLAFAIEHLKT